MRAFRSELGWGRGCEAARPRAQQVNSSERKCGSCLIAIIGL
jgi:hypothetical protein